MRIAVLNNWVPFLAGGAEHLADALVSKLNEYGHEALLVKIPFCWHPASKIIDHILACRCLQLSNVDRLIGLKFPAYYVPHTDKVLWLLHQYRQAYDLWGTPYQDIPDTDEGREIRRVIMEADNTHLCECSAIYTNSKITGDRLRKFNGIPSDVLFPPLLASNHFYCGDFGNYIFCPGRLTSAKRQFLLAQSMAHVRTDVRLVLAGAPERADDLGRIEKILRDYRLSDRVQLIPTFISEGQKAELIAGALACAYIPYDEDSYGYVTLEACHSRKPVLTCSDSGGVHILVQDGVTGYIVQPQPAAIAEGFDRLCSDKSRAKQMGIAAYDRMASLNISWDRVIATLCA
jgi:glycosyltransferase involved in cell wall biosynthesis